MHAMEPPTVSRDAVPDPRPSVARFAAVPVGGLARWQENLAKEMLAAHLGRKLPVAQVAEACQLSRGHFSKAFKRSTGQSPHRWLVGLRVARAQALLMESARPVSEIAQACGFADQSHLTRVFTELTGMAPATWRRAHQLRRP